MFGLKRWFRIWRLTRQMRSQDYRKRTGAWIELVDLAPDRVIPYLVKQADGDSTLVEMSVRLLEHAMIHHRASVSEANLLLLRSMRAGHQITPNPYRDSLHGSSRAPINCDLVKSLAAQELARRDIKSQDGKS